MKIPKITFIEFLQLPETERIELQTIIQNANEFDKTFEINCQEWTMGQVKDAQELLARQKTYDDIIKLVEIAFKYLFNLPHSLNFWHMRLLLGSNYSMCS